MSNEDTDKSVARHGGSREKLLAGTTAELSDTELLAVVLQNGIAKKSTLALGRELLAQYDSIKGVFQHSRALPNSVQGGRSRQNGLA